jgi:hypothetical protein
LLLRSFGGLTGKHLLRGIWRGKLRQFKLRGNTWSSTHGMCQPDGPQQRPGWGGSHLLPTCLMRPRFVISIGFQSDFNRVVLVIVKGDDGEERCTRTEESAFVRGRLCTVLLYEYNVTYLWISRSRYLYTKSCSLLENVQRLRWFRLGCGCKRRKRR